MPIYEYECPVHGVFEVIQKMSDAPVSKCEKCGKPVHKVVSQSSFALKGGGWYKDLYSSTKKDGGSKSESSSAPTASSSTKTDAA